MKHAAAAADYPPLSGRFGGIELGGTKCIVLRADGTAIAESHSFATTTPGDTLGRAAELLAGWHAAAPLDGVGIASFGPVRVDRGAVDHGHILATTKPGWSGAAVIAPVAAAFDGPIALDTDVNGAGLAEAMLGAGRGCRSLVYLTIGTGVGGGVIVEGRPVAGRLHPEIGHLRLRRADGDRFAGACSFHGDCIEGLISGPALAARFGQDPASVDAAHPLWANVAADLAELFAALMLTFSPERIIVGGGAGLGQRQLLPHAIGIAAERLSPYLPDCTAEALTTVIVHPTLGDRAGPLGAILLGAAAAG